MIKDVVIAAMVTASAWCLYYAGFRWNASDQAWLERVSGHDRDDDGGSQE